MPIHRPKTKGKKPVSIPKKIDADIPLPANGDTEQSGASVDKIRDILFGPQIKNYEARFARLEETLARENAQIKDMMARRFDSLESFVKKETEALASRIKAERDERTEVARDIARDLKSATEALTKKIVELDNKTAEAQSGLRQDLLAESRKLMDELRRRTDEITALLEKRANELRADKADRSLIAALLADMAMQISGEDMKRKSVKAAHGE
jgi:DNA repair exonuclease SbcCD ATPase subunit